MMTVIRHGQAEGNTSHRFIGWSDVSLDEVGHSQAEAVAQRLAGAGIQRIISSDIRRAAQTAEPLAKLLGIEVELDERFREIGNGEWTGLLPEDIAARWPDMWDRYVNGSDVDRPGGERWMDVRLRVRAGLADVSADERTTAIFTHGGPVMLSAEWALGLELPGNIFRGVLAAPANSSITTMEAGKLVSYADAGHLGTVSRLDIPYSRADD